VAGPTSAGFGGRKALSGMGNIRTAGVLRLRATKPVSRDKSVRRSAQDDGLRFDENNLNKFALMGFSKSQWSRYEAPVLDCR
jgi:hypothetical protein